MTSGGAENVVATLSNFLSDRNVNVKVFTIWNTPSAYMLNEKIEYNSLLPHSGKPNLKELLFCLMKLRRGIKHIKPDIILTMPSDTACKIIPFLFGLKIPIITSERNNPYMFPPKFFTRMMRQLFFRFADGYVFQTEAAKAYFSNSIKKKSVVIPNPLNANRLLEPFKGTRKKSVVTVGRLVPQKNQALLIRAFARFNQKHPDYTLHIYGEGVLRIFLTELSRSLLPEHAVYFHGSAPDVLEKINDAGIFVFSSNYEGFPNALSEALALGLPCISTDCPMGPSELIISGENGLLVPVNDEDALYNNMCALAEDRDYAERLGGVAISVRKKLDMGKISTQWRDFIEYVCSKK